MSYLDSANERLSDEATRQYTDTVEATRAGTILAHDQKAYVRWRTEVNRRTGRKGVKAGRDLGQLARDFVGGNVVQGEFEFRN